MGENPSIKIWFNLKSDEALPLDIENLSDPPVISTAVALDFDVNYVSVLKGFY